MRSVHPHAEVHFDGGVEITALESSLLFGPTGLRLLRPLAPWPPGIHEHELLDAIGSVDRNLQSNPAAQRARHDEVRSSLSSSSRSARSRACEHFPGPIGESPKPRMS